MATSTKKFGWSNRDDAAYGMLQLVYYAPPRIAQLAIELLPAIRSAAIVPELISIVEDDSREMWHRIYSLRAIAETPGEWYLPQLKHLFMQQLVARQSILQESSEPDQAYIPPDLLNEIGDIAARHNPNREWYFTVLDESESITVVRLYLENMIHREQPDDFRDRLVGYLLNLLNKHPHELDKSLILSLVFIEDSTIREWLDTHIENIVVALRPYIHDPIVVSIAEQWEALRSRLVEIDEEFTSKIRCDMQSTEAHQLGGRKRAELDLVDIHESEAYLHIKVLYQRAKQGDGYAYGRLSQLVRNPNASVPLRTLATNFIGRLGNTHDTYQVLAHLLKYGHAETPEQFTESTIRYEAGVALLDFPTATTWEIFVESYFIRPSNDLAWFQIDAIRYLTDVLSGDSKPVDITQHSNIESNWWFRAIAEISTDELQNI